MSKFLLEGVNLKEDKRRAFYRWYLENKLNNMDPGTSQCSVSLQELNLLVNFNYWRNLPLSQGHGPLILLEETRSIYHCYYNMVKVNTRI